ncbi:MAG: helix-hairpin-helix domain-containing protein, partial [Firmicutes bacterium]|nr:helix-hairpin-helix domain-containing protein [Bacillota bacterium]
KTVSLDRFLHALGIPLVGKKTARDLAFKFGDLQHLQQASLQSLVEMQDIGETTAKMIVEYFADKKNLAALQQFAQYGVCPKVQVVMGGILQGKKFVVTGTLSKARPHFAKQIIDNGGLVGESVTKDTHFLLAGESAGSKLDKAKKLGTVILTEQDFEKMLLG